MRIAKLLSATAMTLTLATAAHADTNTAYIDQDGNGNSALITQDGKGNAAGQSDSTLRIEQVGNNGNVLRIEQVGDTNVVGKAKASGKDGSIRQDGNQSQANSLIVRQGLDGAASSGNTVGSVWQRSRFGMSSDHMIVIDQQGVGNNTINKITQDSYSNNIGKPRPLTGNSTTVTQDGDGNVLDAIGQVGAANTITATFAGNDNGSDGAGSVGSLAGNTGVAAMAGVSASTLQQNGYGNSIDFTTTGNSNQVGIDQDGNRNTVGSLMVTGSGNSIGIDQNQDDNRVTLGVLQGDLNEIGAFQDGSMNALTVNIFGADSDSNSISSSQTGNINIGSIDVDGSNNKLALTQDYDGNGGGGSNFAVIDVKGSSNEFTVAQAGFNDANVKVHSSSNGVNGTSFRGVAAGIGATAGTISQTGGVGPVGRNTVFLDIQSGDSNVFGITQNGQQNNASGIISGGGMNHVAIAQMGDSNATTFTQNGTSNTLGVTQ